MKRSYRLYREQLQKMSVGYSGKDYSQRFCTDLQRHDRGIWRQQTSKDYKDTFTYQTGVGKQMNQPLEPLY